MKAFEIQTFAAGKWRIDSVFDDRELAMFEARRIDQSTRYAGVRVVEETFDESSQLSTTRTIFRGGSADRNARAEPAKEQASGAKPRRNSRNRNARDRAGAKRKQPAKEKKKSMALPLLILGVIVAVGVGALFGLQELSGAF